MHKLLLYLLLLPAIGLSQTSYKSLASEYIFSNLPYSIAEFVERDIIISDKNIVVKSYGSKAIDIQTWRIQNKSYADSETKGYTIYNVELASGEKYQYPASFTLQFNEEGKVETITCEIPHKKHLNLPDNAPTNVRFIID